MSLISSAGCPVCFRINQKGRTRKGRRWCKTDATLPLHLSSADEAGAMAHSTSSYCTTAPLFYVSSPLYSPPTAAMGGTATRYALLTLDSD